MRIIALSTLTLMVTLTYLCVQSSILLLAPFISPYFFPSQSTLTSLTVTFTGYFIGFILRPFGAILFGSLADKSGRKIALTYSMIGVSVIAFALGLIPTYNSIGFLSPITFIFLQLLLGIFSGGTSATGNTMGPEVVPEKLRGLTSGLAGSNGGFSFLISTLLFLLSYSAFPLLGWRAVFILEGFIALGILTYFRLSISESEIFIIVKRTKKRKSSLLDGEVRKRFFKALFLTVGWASIFYGTQGTMTTFLKEIERLQQTSIGTILIYSSISLIVSAIIGGFLSQLYGRKTIALIGGLVVILISPSYLLMVDQGELFISLYSVLIAFAAQFGQGMLTAFVAESFPTEIRGRGVGLTWNIGYGIGSLTPLIIAEFSLYIGLPLILFLFTLIVGVLIVIASIIGGETKGFIEEEKRRMS